jgi:hypothetical protein
MAVIFPGFGRKATGDFLGKVGAAIFTGKARDFVLLLCTVFKNQRTREKHETEICCGSRLDRCFIAGIG